MISSYSCGSTSCSSPGLAVSRCRAANLYLPPASAPAASAAPRQAHACPPRCGLRWLVAHRSAGQLALWPVDAALVACALLPQAFWHKHNRAHATVLALDFSRSLHGEQASCSAVWVRESPL